MVVTEHIVDIRISLRTTSQTTNSKSPPIQQTLPSNPVPTTIPAYPSPPLLHKPSIPISNNSPQNKIVYLVSLATKNSQFMQENMCIEYQESKIVVEGIYIR